MTLHKRDETEARRDKNVDLHRTVEGYRIIRYAYTHCSRGVAFWVGNFTILEILLGMCVWALCFCERERCVINGKVI